MDTLAGKIRSVTNNMDTCFGEMRSAARKINALNGIMGSEDFFMGSVDFYSTP
jgi:hypothetical protein